MQFQVSFFDQAHPKLAPGGVRTKELVIFVYRKVVINLNSAPDAVHKKLYNILAAWVVDRLPKLVLRIDVVRDKALLVF